VTLIEERPSGGIQGVVASADHKRLAALVAVTGLGFFIGAGILALLMRAELATPALTYMSHNTYNELFTIHGSTMIYLFVTPIALALGLYMVPLQVGAADLALSRLALLGYWLYLPGGLLMWAGFLVDQGAGTAGWFSYVPLSTTPFTPGDGMDFWVLSVILATTAQTLWGISLLATIVRRRAPGMTMLRMPVFTWTMLVSVLMVVFSFPSVILAMALLYIDRNGVRIYEGLSGWIDYQHLFWFYGHPVVYVMFFPFVGVSLEVIAVFARKRVFGYKPFVASMLAFSALSMAVWGHHMFATGQIANRYYALTSTALLVPAGVEYFDAAATMIGGSLLLRTPMLFAITFFIQFLIGGVTGIYVASPPLDYHVTDSYFVVAHFHYTLFAGSVFGLFAGIYYWFPKVTGALLREGLGRVHFVLLVIGTNVTFFPMFFYGEDGMSRRVADYPADAGWTTLNVLSTCGSAVIGIAVLVFLVNVVVSLRRRVPAGDDPWNGHTLEWATTSPPPRHNFAALPPVRSESPLWDRKLEEARA
jgi:cytochrome c oxidase subunit I